MGNKPTKPTDPRILAKSVARRAIGVDAPRTKPLKRVNDAKPKKRSK